MEKLGKRQFFQADVAGLGKYHMGGYGWIGVYRVKSQKSCGHTKEGPLQASVVYPYNT